MKSPTPGKILCVGRTYCDLVFSGIANIPTPGQEVFADSFQTFAGGGAYITAAYLAAAGQKSALCSVLPSGPFGEITQAELRHSQVELTHCQTANADWDPQITVVMSQQNDRAFLSRRSGPSVPDTIDKALADPDICHLHIAELATLWDNPDLIEKARSFGHTVSLDCSWDEKIMDMPGVRSMLRGIDVFLPNEAEARKISGCSDLDRIGALFSADVAIIALKQGAKGATLFSQGQRIQQPALAAVVADTTGAGDAFNAGFLASWLNGHALVDCLELGNSFGAEAVKFSGGASGVSAVSGLNAAAGLALASNQDRQHQMSLPSAKATNH